MKEVSPSMTIEMPTGGAHPPTLYTIMPLSLIRNTEYTEMTARNNVAMLEMMSENPFILFPKREFTKAEASGIITNRGNRWFVMIYSSRQARSPSTLLGVQYCSSEVENNYPFNLRIFVISNVPYFSYTLMAMAAINAVTARPITIAVRTSAWGNGSTISTIL